MSSLSRTVFNLVRGRRQRGAHVTFGEGTPTWASARRPVRCRRFRWKNVLAGLCMSIGLGWANQAAAYEDQILVGLDAGYALVMVDNDLPRHAPQFGLTVNLGLNDAWSIAARVGHALHIGDPLLHATSGVAEAVYTLDILQWVPFFGVGTGVILTARDGAIGLDWSLHALIGLDFLATREWIVGVDVRIHALPLALPTTGVAPAYLTLGLRVSRAFEI